MEQYFNDSLLDQQNLFVQISNFEQHSWACYFDQDFHLSPICPGVPTKLFGKKILQLKRQTEAETKINNKKHTSSKVLFSTKNFNFLSRWLFENGIFHHRRVRLWSVFMLVGTNQYDDKPLNRFWLLLCKDQYQNNWIQHVYRMPRTRFPRTILNYRPSGKRSLGRPMKRWKENFM